VSWQLPQPFRRPVTDKSMSSRSSDPYALLERLATSWHDCVEYPSYFLITNDALRHHAFLKLVHPQFLDQVKYAAGQWEWNASKSSARLWLKQWITENHYAARRIVAHSSQMAALLTRFNQDACWEPVWILDCCLALWAVFKFGDGPRMGLRGGEETQLGGNKPLIRCKCLCLFARLSLTDVSPVFCCRVRYSHSNRGMG
jgi:hypothetical protein